MDKTLTLTKLHIIRFGGITEQVFTFSEGINVIYGENRSGKTTLCEFIRFMFYGFEGRDPEDYYPYDAENHSVCGSMTVRYGSRLIEIFREKSPQSEIIAVTDTERGTPVETNKMTPGEYFLGVKSALYDRSLYCPQDMAGLVSGGGLQDYENELIRAYSGEQDFLSLSKALDSRRQELSNPEKTGKIDLATAESEALESELVSAIIKQNEIMNVEAHIASTAEKMLEAEKKIVIAKADIENLHNLHVEEESRRIAAARQELESKKTAYDRLSHGALTPEELEEMTSAYTDLCQKGEELEILEEQLSNTKSNLDMHNNMIDTGEYNEDTLRSISEAVEKRTKLAGRLIIFTLPTFVLSFIVFAILFLMVKSVTLTQALFISGGILSLAAAALITALVLSCTKNSLYKRVGATNSEDFEDAYDLYRSLSQTTDLYRSTYREEARIYKEKAEEYSRALCHLCENLGISADISTMEDIKKLLQEKTDASQKAQKAQIEYQNTLAEYDRLSSSEAIKRNEEHTKLLHEREKELSWYTNQRESLFEKKRSLEEIFSTAVIHTERPMYIKTQLSELNRRIDEYRRDYTALDIACQVLEDALGVMKFRIKNHLSDGVNHNLKFALEENETFLLDDSYCLQYKNSSRLIPVFTDNIARSARAAKGISRSLCEMAALSLRLSLIELLEAENTAAVFDEPFAFIDENGEERILKKLANSRISQIFLFTSHKIDGAEEKYNYFKIG